VTSAFSSMSSIKLLHAFIMSRSRSVTSGSGIMKLHSVVSSLALTCGLISHCSLCCLLLWCRHGSMLTRAHLSDDSYMLMLKMWLKHQFSDSRLSCWAALPSCNNTAGQVRYLLVNCLCQRCDLHNIHTVNHLCSGPAQQQSRMQQLKLAYWGFMQSITTSKAFVWSGFFDIS